MVKFNPLKLVVLYALTIVPLGGVVLSMALSAGSKHPGIDGFAGFFFECIGAVVLGALIVAYVAGIRFLCRAESGD